MTSASAERMSASSSMIMTGPRGTPSSSSSSSLANLRRGRRHRQRQLDGERGAHADFALDADAAAVRLDDLSRDVEADAEAAILARRHRPLEALEDPRQIV